MKPEPTTHPPRCCAPYCSKRATHYVSRFVSVGRLMNVGRRDGKEPPVIEVCKEGYCVEHAPTDAQPIDRSPEDITPTE